MTNSLLACKRLLLLLMLLFAANSLLPAPPPSKLIVSHSTLPSIRITSELKRPEAVVIDTTRPGYPPDKVSPQGKIVEVADTKNVIGCTVYFMVLDRTEGGPGDVFGQREQELLAGLAPGRRARPGLQPARDQGHGFRR